MNNKYVEKNLADYKKADYPNVVYGREYLISKVREYSKGLVINSNVYKEFLRALLSTIKLSFVNSQQENVNVKLHHGRQERVVAKKFQENNLILPYSTIYQSAVISDDTRRRTSSILTTTTEWNDNIRRAQRVFSEPDVPVNIEYTLSLWTKYVSDMDQLSSKIRSHFNPQVLLETPFSTLTPVYIKEETDDSTTTVLDKEDRLLRKNIVLEVQTYIPSPKFLITSTGKITHVNTEIWV